MTRWALIWALVGCAGCGAVPTPAEFEGVVELGTDCLSQARSAEDIEACAVGIALGVQAMAAQACVEVAPIVSEGVRAAIDAIWGALVD